ncbi:class I SAM-dependent methyltransferase [Euzebya tangerina]|uniref:class I SAM-dependent methyltransferase n=1 Tax=Euzebya tangerina TaxID=591198 RepID=UPI0013C331D5|nr:methyltransferase domain-containing protein [Euzebya tangerina]
MRVDEHYSRQADLSERVQTALQDAGLDPGDLTADDLAGVDEFHLGGRAATIALLDDLDLTDGMAVLDVGCGIGGVTRTIARRHAGPVTGVDLTPDFVDAARALTALVGLSEQIRFQQADALALPFDAETFDAVVLVHVGMNIHAKDALIRELARVTVRGGTVAVYDIMRISDGPLSFPLPWASSDSMSWLASPDVYGDVMAAAGLVPGEAVDRRPVVRQALADAAANPPPVNLSHLMGSEWPAMFANLRAALQAGILAPTQILASKPSG